MLTDDFTFEGKKNRNEKINPNIICYSSGWIGKCLFSFLFVSASYVTGNVPANGYVTTTWAGFESVDTPPAYGSNTGTAFANGCYQAEVTNGQTREYVTGCYWNGREKTAYFIAAGDKTYPYSAWLGQ